MDHFLVDYENIGEAGLKGIENLSSDTSTIIFYSEHADKISFEMHQKLTCCRSKLEFRKAETGKKNALDFQLSTYLGYLVASNPGDRFFIISKDNGYRVVMDFWNKANVAQLDYIGRAYERAERRAVPVPDRKAVPVPETQAAPVPEVQTAPAPEAQDAPTPEAQTVSAHEMQDAPVQKKNEPAVKKPEISETDTGTAETAKYEDRPLPKAEEKAESEKPAGEVSAESAKRTRRGGRRKNSAPGETPAEEKPSDELMNALAQLIDDREERENIGRFIVKYKTKQGVNNAIVKIYGTEKAGELYKKIKPLLKDKKGK